MPRLQDSLPNGCGVPPSPRRPWRPTSPARSPACTSAGVTWRGIAMVARTDNEGPGLLRGRREPSGGSCMRTPCFAVPCGGASSIAPSPFLASDCRHCADSLLYRSEHLCFAEPTRTDRYSQNAPGPVGAKAETLARGCSPPTAVRLGSQAPLSPPAETLGRRNRSTPPAAATTATEPAHRHRGNGRAPPRPLSLFDFSWVD
jgi:hypothetical protein